MGWNDPDVYNNPEKFGLELVSQIDYSDGCYQFDYRCVWYHKESNTLYTARDSGCSCPSPFEDFNKLSDLETMSLSDIEEEVLEERKADHYSGDDPNVFLEEIRTADKKRRESK